MYHVFKYLSKKTKFCWILCTFGNESEVSTPTWMREEMMWTWLENGREGKKKKAGSTDCYFSKCTQGGSKCTSVSARVILKRFDPRNLSRLGNFNVVQLTFFFLFEHILTSRTLTRKRGGWVVHFLWPSYWLNVPHFFYTWKVWKNWAKHF